MTSKNLTRFNVAFYLHFPSCFINFCPPPAWQMNNLEHWWHDT
jgi:hypothetical protein